MSRMRVVRSIVGAMLLALLCIARVVAEEADQPRRPLPRQPHRLLPRQTGCQPRRPAPPTAPVAAPAPAAAPAADSPPEKGPPLPVHTIEGVGGGAITPMAYLVNPAPEGCFFGKPSAALSYVGLEKKNLDAITVTENLLGRVELGFAADRLGLGDLPQAIRTATGVDIGRSDVWLYHFNLRYMAVKENDCIFGFQAPAITMGVDFKENSDIEHINESLSGALSKIGYATPGGEDFTLHATKTFPKLFCGRPLIATVGMRESEAADLGFLGFGNAYHATVEANVAVLPVDKLLIAYEFRQKTDPFSGTIDGLIGGEDNWQSIDVVYIPSKNFTFATGWGHFGNLANAEANGAWFLQLKYEF